MIRNITWSTFTLCPKAHRVAAHTPPFSSSSATSSVRSVACSRAVILSQTATTRHMPTAPHGVSRKNRTSVSVRVPRPLNHNRPWSNPTASGTRTTNASSLKSTSARKSCRHPCRRAVPATLIIILSSSRNVPGTCTEGSFI